MDFVQKRGQSHWQICYPQSEQTGQSPNPPTLWKQRLDLDWDSGFSPTSYVRWASHLLEAGPVSALPEHCAGLPGPALLGGDDGDQQHADSDPGEARGRRSAHLPGRLQAAHRAELQHWDQRLVIKTRSSIYYIHIITAPPNVEIKNKPLSGEIVAEEGSRLELQCEVSSEASTFYRYRDTVILGMFTDCEWKELKASVKFSFYWLWAGDYIGVLLTSTQLTLTWDRWTMSLCQ